MTIFPWTNSCEKSFGYTFYKTTSIHDLLLHSKMNMNGQANKAECKSKRNNYGKRKFGSEEAFISNVRCLNAMSVSHS